VPSPVILPDRRVVVRFDFSFLGRRVKIWMLIAGREAELCRFDPGFGDDLVVTITDPLTFARWHLGLVEWAAALRSGGIHVSGTRTLSRALPTWNAGPETWAQRRQRLQPTPGSAPATLP
jgi:hypothetical protein